jgi:hypothetical protein
MFRDTSIPFPGANVVLGWNLGLAINVRLAMIQKILKEKGQVV